MLKKKPYIEKDKALAERRLAARLELLKSKGLTDPGIQRDAAVRHLKGDIRQAGERLARIEELEESVARKAEIKAGKLAAPKADRPRKKHGESPSKKKARIERKQAAVEPDEE